MDAINVMISKLNGEYSIGIVGCGSIEECRKVVNDEAGSDEEVVDFIKFESNEEGFEIIRAATLTDGPLQVLEELLLQVFKLGQKYPRPSEPKAVKSEKAPFRLSQELRLR